MTDEPLPTGYALRRLDPSDLPALRALYGAVAAALPDPKSYRLYGGAESFFANHCGERGESLGIFDASGLVAYGSLTFPTATDCDNYANDLGWAAARASSVALLSAAMVAPGARGLGLHGALIRARLDRAARLGKREALARAAPPNARSRRNLLHAGFAIVWVGLQAEGSLRHIYWRPTDRAGWPGSPGAGPPPVWADPLDLPAQTLLLSEGRAGVRARESDGWIGFAPLVALRPAQRADAAGPGTVFADPAHGAPAQFFPGRNRKISP